MSEDEIIERVNKFINITILYGKIYGMTCDDLKKYQQVFQGLLDLYDKEKEKNKELENADLTTIYINGFYDGEKKWKDKIKDKIYQLNTSDILEEQIAITYLKELLEEV